METKTDSAPSQSYSGVFEGEGFNAVRLIMDCRIYEEVAYDLQTNQINFRRVNQPG